MKALFAAAVALAAVTAQAADNSTILVCETTETSIGPYLYSKAQLAGSTEALRSIRMTVGQDMTTTAPIFEARFDLVDGEGRQLRDGKSVMRIAYTESKTTGRATVTYAPNRSTGPQGVRPFSLLVDEDHNAKMTFLQIGSRNAPNRPAQFTCTKTGSEVGLPSAVDLSQLSNADKARVLEQLVRALPSKTIWGEEARQKSPPGVVDAALSEIRTRLENLDITEKDFKSRTYFGDSTEPYQLEIAPKGPGRCGELYWNHFKPVRDFSGQIVAYSGKVTCKDVAVKLTRKRANGKEYTDRFNLQYVGFFAAGSDVISTSKTDYDFNQIFARD